MLGRQMMGALALTGSLGIAHALPALLLGAMLAAPMAAHAQAARRYDLPASALDQALTRFGNDAGILLSFDSALTASKSTAGLRGSYTVPQGFAALLAGTGLEAVARQDGSYTLRRAAAAGPTGATVLPAVTVTAATYGVARSELPAPYAGGQVARGAGTGILGTRDLLDIPFAVTSYTEKTIKDQQAQSVADIVVNDASVRNVDPTNTGYANTFTVRGLILGNGSIALGGLFGLAPNNQTTLAGIERVEVMKGPTAFLNGMSPSGTAGAINLVPKRAGDEALTEFTGSYLSDSQVGGHLDVGRRFGDDKQFGIRVNALYRDGDTSVDEQSQKLGSGSVGLDFRHERVRLSADAGYQKIDTDRANSTIAPQVGQAVPDAPSASKSFMSPWNFVDTRDYFGLVRGEVDVTPSQTFYASAGKSHTDWKQVLDFGTLLRSNGDFRSTTSMNFTGIDRTVAEAGWRGRLDTGPVQHEFNVGANTYRSERTSVGTIGLGTVASNIYRPVFNAAPAIPSLTRRRSSDTVLTGVVLSDTLSILDERAQLTLGCASRTSRPRTTAPLPAPRPPPTTSASSRRWRGS
jgi:iron complex outermembrane receptor protein